MALQSLQALVVKEEVEKDPVAHIVLDFPLVTISIFLHPLCGMGKGFPHILQQLLAMLRVSVCHR